MLREDFKYIINVPYPHDSSKIRDWMHENKINFIYYTGDKSADYKMLHERDAVLFGLRWM